MANAWRWVLAGWCVALCACTAPSPHVAPVAPEGATPVGPFAPEARVLFEGCIPIPDSATSRLYRCGEVTVWLVERKDVPAERVLALARARVVERLGEQVVVAGGELPLAGRSWPAARFAVCEAGEARACRAGGYLVSVAAESGRQRELGCVARGNGAPGLARCLEFFEYLASHGNPEGDVLDVAGLLLPPRLPWRSLAVPDGCQPAASTSRAGRIRCEDASFVWSVYRPARAEVTERWRDQGVSELREALPGAGPVEEVACRLEQLPARCLRFTAPSARGPLVVWVGAVEWKDRALFASCGFLAKSAPGFPAVCNGAFSLP
ncbi:lipoprotein [Myxococcus stipitatus DSM 14675]|uniref:Lipoprotein n=1 Tax=Myxococcus stipitatus (strain DSM 14675 / JCM 12634 / Mx s8) TaxID=1278073 RepID=L7U183_MYXSD|nr:lipoprotein [Myxococcus stipitatus DSM 14675]